MSQIPAIEGQCGTCRFAAAFGSADCPSGPEDAVHCTSQAHALMMDEYINPEDEKDDLFNQYQKELAEYGFVNLWRYETLAEESYRCQNWEAGDVSKDKVGQ